MKRKDYRGARCIKRVIPKCKEVLKTYNPLQDACADILTADENVKEIKANVELEEEDYTTDFLCVMKDGSMMVRECVYRKNLIRPLTAKLLQLSFEYWTCRGITDWGVCIENED